MRDQDLVQAQNQLDAIAAAMASALSDKTTDGTAVDVRRAERLQRRYREPVDRQHRHDQLHRHRDHHAPHHHPGARRRSVGAAAVRTRRRSIRTTEVVGIDFSGGMASVITQINTALAGTGMTASNPSGTTLQILDDGAGQYRGCQRAVSTTTTATSLAGGTAELPLLHRRQPALHRRDHASAVAERRLCRAHHRQRGAARRSVGTGHLSSGHRGRRHHPPGFHLQQLTADVASIPAEHRHRHGRGAIFRNAQHLSCAR